MADETVNLVLKARDEATRQVQGLAKELGGLPGLVNKLSIGAGPWGALIGGATSAASAAVVLGQRLSDNVERMDNLRIATGASIPEIQVFEQSFKNMGATQEDADSLIRRVTKSIGEQDPELKRLGVTTRNATAATLQLAEIYARTEDPATRMLISTKLFGKAGLESAGQIAQLADQVRATRAIMSESGGLISPEELARVRELDTASDQLKTRWASVWTSMQLSAVPAATKIVEAADNILAAMKRIHTQANEGKDEQERAFERMMRKSQGLPVFEGFGGGASRGHGGGASFDRTAGDQGSDARIERLKEIERLLHVGRAAAAQYAATLDQVTDASKANNLQKAFLEGMLAKSGADLSTNADGVRFRSVVEAGPQDRLRVDRPVSQADLDRWNKAQKEAIANASKMSGALITVTANWKEMLEESTRAEAAIDGAIAAANNGLNIGLQGALGSTGEGFKSLERIAIDAIKGIERELAAMAEQMAATGIMKLITGTILGIATGGVGGVVAGIAGGAGLPTPRLPGVGDSMRRAGGASSVHYHFSALDMRSLRMQMMSPSSPLYRAFADASVGRRVG